MGAFAVVSDANFEEALLPESPYRLPRTGVGDVASRAPSMAAVLDLLRRAAMVNTTVLIGGESGTGKDVVARTIHDYSPRNSGPFVAMNCAAIPDTLAEAELFGHEKGAFTGATAARIGRFQAAEGGTLFIDEIGDLPLALQGKFLRVLETRMVTPLGGHRDIPFDVRIIAATNKDLEAMVAKQLFREDLFYRLNVIGIKLPPLRERLEDIEPLALHFLQRVNARNATHVTRIAPAAWERLWSYHWPGNIRELLNVIERGVVFCRATVLEADDIALPVNPREKQGPMANPNVSRTASNPTNDRFPTLKNLEESAIASALVQFPNNRTRAARALGISVRTLQRKLAAKKPTFHTATNRCSEYLAIRG